MELRSDGIMRLVRKNGSPIVSFLEAIFTFVGRCGWLLDDQVAQDSDRRRFFAAFDDQPLLRKFVTTQRMRRILRRL